MQVYAWMVYYSPCWPKAVADIRRIREAHHGELQPEVQRQKFEAWERGQMVSSAGFLLDFSHAWNLPSGAVNLSRSVLQAEEPYLDELVAASWPGFPGGTNSRITACAAASRVHGVLF